MMDDHSSEISAVSITNKSLRSSGGMSFGGLSNQPVDYKAMLMNGITNPKEVVKSILKLKVNQVFKHKLQYKFLMKIAIAYSFVFCLLLRYSKKVQRWTKNLLVKTLYTATILGLVGTAAAGLIKYRLYSKAH